mmetsp:Transcript_28877/g.48479  ORF Transcript_28877/g.48479 Transcript_28877/m.48479 type:complete len:90 (+) Transcript_28877:121-390(+)
MDVDFEDLFDFSDSEDSEPPEIDIKKRRKSDTDLAMRWSVISELCLMRRDLESNLPNGSLTFLAQKYGMGERTIRSLWRNYKNQLVNGL